MDLNALLARVDAVKVGIRQVAIFVFVLAVAIGLTTVFVSLEFEFGWLGGAVGIGILLTLASRRYRRHLETVSGSWKAREEIGTAVGLLLVAYGASTLETASERSSTWLGTVGVALVLVGLVPVAFAIRKDVKGPGRLTPAATRTPLAESVKVWSANLLVAVLAVVPALTMVGVYWVIAFVVAIAWVLAEAASRSIAKERRRPWPGMVAIVTLAVSIVFVVPFTALADSTTWAFIWIVAIAVAVMLAAIIVLSAQVSLGRFADWPLRPLAHRNLAVATSVAGAFVALVSLVALWNRLEGIQTYLKIGLVVGLLVIGVTFVVRGEGFVLAALLGALTVWTLVDRTEPVEPTKDGKAHHPGATGYMVAFGDSYSAGEGSDTFLPGTNISGGNDCRRSRTAYPQLIAAKLTLPLKFFSCSGAKASQLYDEGQIKVGAEGDPIGIVPQLDNFSSVAADGTPPKLVVVTIGGNDAFFGLVGKGCALPGSCEEVKGVLRTNLNYVSEGVEQTLQRVADAFPSTPVVVVPYPEMLFPGAEGCDEVPLQTKEYSALAVFVAQLNTAIETTAGRMRDRGVDNVEFFAPGRNAYVGHQLCDPDRQGDPALNAIRLAPTDATSLAGRLNPQRWIHGTFHPKKAGHQLMADALYAWLYAEHPELIPGGAAPPAVAVPSPETAPRAASKAEVLKPDESPPAADEPPCQKDTCRAFVDKWIITTAAAVLRALLLPTLGVLAGSWLAAVGVVAFGRRRDPAAPVTAS